MVSGRHQEALQGSGGQKADSGRWWEVVESSSNLAVGSGGRGGRWQVAVRSRGRKEVAACSGN